MPTNVRANIQNTVVLKLAGKTSTGEGRNVAADINGLVARCNTLLGRTDPAHLEKVTAKESDLMFDKVKKGGR